MRHPRLQPLGVVALILAAANAQAAGAELKQAAGPGLGLKLDPALSAPPPSDGERTPVFVDADEIRGRQGHDVEARGAARLRSRDKRVFADWLYYQVEPEEVQAAGNVRLEQDGDVLTGTRLKLDMQTERGYLQDPTFRLGAQNARGDAREFLFIGENRYRVDRGRYTTCGPGEDDWFLRARELDLNRNTNVGTAYDASVVFFGQPILYTPWMNFPLSEERKSGFLSPTIGTGGKTGFEFAIPYYWNIAPHRDATITPHFMARRGLMLGGEFRYLDRAYAGEVRGEVLPGDRVTNDDRWAAYLLHTQTVGPWSLYANVQRVSDDNYFRDLSTQIAATSQIVLPALGQLSRGGSLGNGRWSLRGRVQNWQTLQDPKAPITPPYDRMPQVTLDTYNFDVFNTDILFSGSYTRFDHPTLVSGQRYIAYPNVTVPLQTPAVYVRPKIGLHYTRYDLDESSTTTRDATRSVPIFSTDAGVVLERDTTYFGKQYLHTLEPKLYYVYIPFREQSHLPNFESGLADVNFATIYSENQFSGEDRINDANQMTLGLVSRLIDPQTGIERLRAGIAQRFYFKDQRVTLPGDSPRTGTRSDLLAAVSGQIAPSLIMEAGVRYDHDLSETRKFAIGARYQPDLGKVLNVGYRFTRGQLKNFDLSAQWPIFRGLSGVGRVNYSLRDRRVAEGLAGLEYNGGCWVVRLVTYNVTVATGDTSRSVFLQLELNGVARVGSNPLEALRQNIAGYTKINEPQGSTLPPLRQ